MSWLAISAADSITHADAPTLPTGGPSVFLPIVFVPQPAPNPLDPTFGSGGIVTQPLGQRMVGNSFALQPDGKILLGGFGGAGIDFMIARFNGDGTLDTGFGSGGIASADFYQSDYGQAIAAQPDGKVVQVGNITAGLAGNIWGLARYNGDGTLDSTFLNGGRFVDASMHGLPFALTIQPDGKLVLAGSNGRGQFALERFAVDGTTDLSFGNAGKVSTPINNYAEVQALALQSDGKLVAGGLAGTGGIGAPDDMAIARYNRDGSLDSGFGQNGIVILDTGYYEQVVSLAVHPDGKILATGRTGPAPSTPYDLVLARYLPNGTLDHSFGNAGKVIFHYGNGFTGLRGGIQADGKIIAAGSAGNDFVVIRFQSDGALDSAFGTGGIISTDFGLNVNLAGFAIQPDGKVIVGGSSYANSTTLVLARYLAQ